MKKLHFLFIIRLPLLNNSCILYLVDEVTNTHGENKMAHKENTKYDDNGEIKISWVKCPTACDVIVDGVFVERIFGDNPEVEQLMNDGLGKFTAMKQVARATGRAFAGLVA